MPAILVTRPKEQGRELVEKLRGLGYDVFHEPLLTLRYLDTPRPALSALDGVIITSRVAVWALQQYKNHCPDLFSLPCFCVGEQTAEAARDAGFSHIISVQPTGQQLAEEMIKQLEKGVNTLHICGAIRSPEPQALLEQNGIRVVPWVTYEAIEAKSLSTELIDAMRKGGIAAILLLSAHTALVWEKLVKQHDLQSCCGYVMAIGLSDNVTHCLNADQYAKVCAPSSPTQAALIASVREVVPNS